MRSFGTAIQDANEGSQAAGVETHSARRDPPYLWPSVNVNYRNHPQYLGEHFFFKVLLLFIKHLFRKQIAILTLWDKLLQITWKIYLPQLYIFGFYYQFLSGPMFWYQFAVLLHPLEVCIHYLKTCTQCLLSKNNGIRVYFPSRQLDILKFTVRCFLGTSA